VTSHAQVFTPDVGQRIIFARTPKVKETTPAPANAPVPKSEPCPQTEIFNDRQADSLRTAIGAVDPESFLIPPNHFGLCHKDASTLKDDAERAMAAWVQGGGAWVDDRGKKLPKITKASLNGGANDWSQDVAKTEDYMAYDIMMRTLAAEVGNDRACPEPYKKAAARIILNRIEDRKLRKKATAVKSMKELLDNVDLPDQGGASVRPIDPESRAGLDNFAREATKDELEETMSSGLEKFKDEHPIVRAVLNKAKFMCWAPKSAVYKTAVCPTENYGLKPLRRISRIAVEAIFHEDRFRKTTDEVTALEYTTGEWTHWIRKCQGYTQVFPAVDGVTINSLECMQLWRAPKKRGDCDLDKLEKKWMQFHGGKPPPRIF